MIPMKFPTGRNSLGFAVPSPRTHPSVSNVWQLAIAAMAVLWWRRATQLRSVSFTMLESRLTKHLIMLDHALRLCTLPTCSSHAHNAPDAVGSVFG